MQFKLNLSKNQAFNISFENYILEIKDKSKVTKTNIKVFRNIDNLPFNTTNTVNSNEEEILKILNANFKGTYSKIKNNQLLEQFASHRFYSDDLVKAGILNDGKKIFLYFSFKQRNIFS